MITNKNEAETMTKLILCDCKSKFNSTAYNSNQKWNNKICQCEFKNYRKSKKDYTWNPSTCICENGKYSKSIADTLGIEFGEIVSVMDLASTKMENTISTNVTKIVIVKRYKFDCYILYTVLSAIILLLIITIICYHHATYR